MASSLGCTTRRECVLELADLSGIDWHKWPTPGPWRKDHHERPGIDDHEYNEYAWKHCEDLIKRHKPYVLWGDIDWPKS